MKLLAIMMLAGTVLVAQAQSVMFNVDLDGGQEVPSLTTTGMGFGSLTLNTNTGAISYDITFSGLMANSILMHIHQAPPGIIGGVIWNFDASVNPGAGFTPGSMSGNVVGSGMIDPAEIPNMLAGNTYVNIHSEFSPGGEIRGQLYVPEPATASLFALAGLSLVLWRRRS